MHQSTIISILALAATSMGAALNNCKTQPQGTCTFLFGGSEGALDDVQYDCVIFDNNCNIISTTGAGGSCEPGTSVKSSLPNTADVKARGGMGKGDLFVTFNYATVVYDKNSPGHEYFDCSSGLAGCTQLYIPFAC